MKSQRIYYLDILRIIAIIAVIMIHVSSQSLYYSADVRSFTWQSLNFWDAINRWCVPIFVMISGVLFLDPKKPFNMKKLLHKNILRLIYFTIFWHIVYGIFNYIEVGSLREAVVTTIEGYSHLWFLHMIIGVYLLVPLLRKITESIELTRYFLLLSVLFTFLLPTISDVYNSLVTYQPMPAAFKIVGDSFAISFFRIYFNFTLGFSAYFVAGYYFHRVQLTKKWRFRLYIAGIVSLLVTIFATAGLSYHYSTIMIPLYSYTSLNVMFVTFAIFTFVKQLGQSINFEAPKYQKWLKYLVNLSKIVMGIYLVHFFMVRILIHYLNGFELINNAFIAVPIISLIVFISSIILTKICHKIPILKNFMM